MRITRVATASGPRLGVESGDHYVALATEHTSLTDFLRSADRFPHRVRWETSGEVLRGRPLAPLRPGKIIAIGLNYRDHARECGLDVPIEPLIFTKFSTAVIGPDDHILVNPALTERVDWEVELAVVIGRRARHVTPHEALSFVAGYTVANDVSARDLQFRDTQWVRGKSLDTFCPLGPVVVTADEIGDPQKLGLRTYVNGVAMQDSSTLEMIFPVAELISFCSRSFTLEPGDVILTGTPWGCGEFMNPVRCLQDGDLVEVTIDDIGTMRNRVQYVPIES